MRPRLKWKPLLSPLGDAGRSPSRLDTIARKTLFPVLTLFLAISWSGIALCDDAQVIANKTRAPVYLHLLGTNRAKNHDPEDWRPLPDDKWKPTWSCVATILIHNDRRFYLRVPGNREPFVKLDGHAAIDASGLARLQIEYELDDSNMTYIKTEKFKTKLDRFMFLADGFYWCAILSRHEDAYEAFESAQENARSSAKK
ncbi:hypothetical protein [Rhodopirellula baltica]